MKKLLLFLVLLTTTATAQTIPDRLDIIQEQVEQIRAELSVETIPVTNITAELSADRIEVSWQANSSGTMDIQYYAPEHHSEWQHSVARYRAPPNIEDEFSSIGVGIEADWLIRVVVDDWVSKPILVKQEAVEPEPEEPEIEYTDFDSAIQNQSGNFRYTGDYKYFPFKTDAPITLINSTNSLKLDVAGNSNTGVLLGGLGNEETILENFDIRNVLQKDRNTVDTSAGIRIERGGNYVVRDGKITGIDSESYSNKPVTRGIHIINSGSDARNILIDNVEFSNIITSTITNPRQKGGMDADAIVIRDDKGASPEGKRVTTIQNSHFSKAQKRFIKGNDPDEVHILNNEFHVDMPMHQVVTMQEPSQGTYKGNRTYVSEWVNRGKMLAFGGSTAGNRNNEWGRWEVKENYAECDGGDAIWIEIYGDFEIDLIDNEFIGCDYVIYARVNAGTLTINRKGNSFDSEFIRSNGNVVINEL